MILLLPVLGMLVGLGAALFGLGGNVFIIPLLPSIVDLTLRETISTGIFTVLFVTLVNVISFGSRGLVDWKLGAQLLLPTSLFSFISSKYAYLIPDSYSKLLLVAIMLFMAIRLVLFKGSPHLKNGRFRMLFAQLAGVVSGSLAGLTGIGSGVILGPILLGFNLTEEKKVSPTINLLIFVACFFATLNNLNFGEFSFQSSGSVRIDYALLIFAFSLIGSWYGRRWNVQIESGLRKKVIAGILVLLCLKLYL